MTLMAHNVHFIYTHFENRYWSKYFINIFPRALTLEILLLVIFDWKRVVVEYDLIQISKHLDTFSVHNINIPKLL